ncbi:MAG: acyloxyacyl hydrolase [Chitinophagaceae bacterium]
MKLLMIGALLLFILFSKNSSAQGRAQYPKALNNSYFGVNIGHINYPFSSLQLEPGYQVKNIVVPHTGIRLVLFGHEFNKNLSAQITYMRPALWVRYQNVDGDEGNHSVWINVGGLTLKGTLPVSKKLAAYGEAGLGIITRSGFEKDGNTVVSSANYSTVLLGGGVQFRPNRNWDFILSAAYSPRDAKTRQPHTMFVGAGFNYTMRTLPDERLKEVKTAGYKFPKKNMIQVGYSTLGLGHGVNDFVAEGKIPIFWGGRVWVDRGLSVYYQRNIFHTKKVFALDWGTSVGFWRTEKNKENFFTLSAYPILRWTLLRTKPTDFYFYYSVAGPTYISRKVMDDIEIGKHFTFQDLMGVGIFTGKDRQINAEIKIGHFSNGNIFPVNRGVGVPLTFNAGYTF